MLHTHVCTYRHARARAHTHTHTHAYTYVRIHLLVSWCSELSQPRRIISGLSMYTRTHARTYACAYTEALKPPQKKIEERTERCDRKNEGEAVDRRDRQTEKKVS